MKNPLTIYRVLAWIVGVLLIPVYLFWVTDIVKDGSAWMAVYPAHGFLFIAYCIVGFTVARMGRFSLGKTVAIFLAGLLPFVTFYVERRVTRDVHAAIAAQ